MAIDSSTTTSKTITLRDGRSLGYAEYGDPEGRPIFHFHGWPSSRLDAQLFAEVAAKFGVRLAIGPIDLGTEGMRPINRATSFAARWFPWLLRPTMWVSMGRFNRDVEKMGGAVEKVMQAIPESDKKLMRDPKIKQMLVAAFYESFRQGSKGPAYDGMLYGHPWGFQLEDISLGKVYLWHGERDVNVPVSMGRGVANAIPHCQARFYPNDAHFLLTPDHQEEIMTAMTSTGSLRE